MTSEIPSQQSRAAKFGPILVNRQHELRRRLNAIEQDFEQPRDRDDADRAIERNNDEVLEELGDAGQRELLAIEAAIQRLEAGSFGFCVSCGNEIEERRLDAVPHTPFCQSCAAERAA